MIVRSLKPETASLAACPICGQPAGDPAWSAPNREPQAFTCAACDLTFIWPRIAQDVSADPVEAYYADWELLDYSACNFYVADVGSTELDRIARTQPGS